MWLRWSMWWFPLQKVIVALQSFQSFSMRKIINMFCFSWNEWILWKCLCLQISIQNKIKSMSTCVTGSIRPSINPTEIRQTERRENTVTECEAGSSKVDVTSGETRWETDYCDNKLLSSYLKIAGLSLCQTFMFYSHCVKHILHFLCWTQQHKQRRADRRPHTDSSAGQKLKHLIWILKLFVWPG